jgi:hypothetical protein
VRNGAVHILDYKPDAGTNKPIAQLAIYAPALTHRIPGLRLFDITRSARGSTRSNMANFSLARFSRQPHGSHVR